MQNKTAEEMAEDLSSLLREKLGVRGNNLEAKLANAGRLLPRRVRRKADVIVEAVRFSSHPKLARMTDEAMLKRAYSDVEFYLQKIDPADLRKGRLINFFGLLSFNLLAVLALLLTFLVWQGIL